MASTIGLKPLDHVPENSSALVQSSLPESSKPHMSSASPLRGLGSRGAVRLLRLEL